MSPALSWSQFEEKSGPLAELGRKLLYQFGVGLGMLATSRRDGGPRVHPVCPNIFEGALYVFVVGQSPKRADLARDGRFALHTFPAPADDESFYCTGRALEIRDPELRARATAAFVHHVKPDEALFELRLTSALHTTWLEPRTPQTRPVFQRWRA